MACGQEPSGLIGSSEPGISEEGWRKTKDKDYIKEPVIGFKTPQLGIRAQIQHLKAYANTKSGINTIAEVNSSWGIKNPFFFQKKVFYWGTKEEQKEIYVLEEGETILSLNKYGDLWEAETIAIPWIHHSQEVEVQHSKYSGIVTVEKTIVRSDDTGAVHMYIYFAGGEKDV